MKRSKMDRPKEDVIPAEYVLPAITVVVITAWIYWYFHDAGEQNEYMTYVLVPFGIFMALALFLIECKSFHLDDEGMEIRLFGLRLRRVSWFDIAQIGIASSHFSYNHSYYIIVTLEGCPRFIPGKDGGKYLERHPFRAIQIVHLKYALPLIEKYYGDLDYGREDVDDEYLKYFA